MPESFSLKDQLFNRVKVSKIAREIKIVFPKFEEDKFIEETVYKFPELKLKECISYISKNLKKYLPNDYKTSLQILINSLPDHCDPNLSDNDFGDFIYAPYGDFVVNNGLDKENFEISIEAIKHFTTRFSMEDAIRYFINLYPKETLDILYKWTKDSHYHVRRLASEGTRPKLPWCLKININPKDAIHILDELFFDKTRFVTRSVANHMNDISKIDIDLCINTLKKWKESQKQSKKEMNYIINHALRTLIKKGDKKALNLLGISNDPKIEISNFKLPEILKMNDYLEFSFDIKSLKTQELIIDYIIYFQNKSGKLGNKVFKLKKIKLNKNQFINISKKHLFKEKMTTRTLYQGNHKFKLQINGKILKVGSFDLIK